MSLPRRIAPLVLASMAPLVAGAADYDPEATAWNGCSELLHVGRTAGFLIDASQRLDWGMVEQDETLVIIYPAQPDTPDVGNTLRFLADGGRLLLADDFGGAAAVLEALELERRAPPDGDAHYGDDPDLPWARAVDPDHVLASRGARSVLGNHPAYLRTRLPPVFVFGAGTSDHAAVVEGRYGDGLFVIVSDPSMLINAMLRHPANRAFAANVLERVAGVWSAPGEGDAGEKPPRRFVHLLWGGFREVGHYAMEDGGDMASRLGLGTIEEHVREFGRWLGSLAGRPLPPLVGRFLGMLSIFVVLIVVLWFLPTTRRHYDGDWFGRGSAAPHRALAARRDLATAARILEEELWAVLLEGERKPPPRDSRAGGASTRVRGSASAELLADEVLRANAKALGIAADMAAGHRAQRRAIARTVARLQRLTAASYDTTPRGTDPSASEFLSVWRECRDLVVRCGKGTQWPGSPKTEGRTPPRAQTPTRTQTQ